MTETKLINLFPTIDKSCLVCEKKYKNPVCVSSSASAFLNNRKVTTTYKSGQSIFNSGDAPVGIYAISTGLIKLEKNSIHGSTHTTSLIGAGSVFGYRSLLDNSIFDVTAVAVEESIVCFFPKVEFLNLLKQDPDISLRLLLQTSKDLDISENKWLDQMDKDATQRVANALLFLTEHFGPHKWTRKDIAQWAGTTPETVIRTLAQFEKEKLIDQSEGRQIKILNKSLLSEKTH